MQNKNTFYCLNIQGVRMNALLHNMEMASELCVMLYSFSHKMLTTNYPIYLHKQKILCRKAMQIWLLWNGKGHKFLYINGDFISVTVPLTPIWDQVHHNQHIYDCRFSSWDPSIFLLCLSSSHSQKELKKHVMEKIKEPKYSL
jgi:hypothetical protein